MKRLREYGGGGGGGGGGGVGVRPMKLLAKIKPKVVEKQCPPQYLINVAYLVHLKKYLTTYIIESFILQPE
jgi:hypothetical protein